MRAYAKELIGTAPDVAVADSTPAALALQRESRTTPIIFIQAGNPVGSGLVANLVDLRAARLRHRTRRQAAKYWVEKT